MKKAVFASISIALVGFAVACEFVASRSKPTTLKNVVVTIGPSHEFSFLRTRAVYNPSDEKIKHEFKNIDLAPPIAKVSDETHRDLWLAVAAKVDYSIARQNDGYKHADRGMPWSLGPVVDSDAIPSGYKSNGSIGMTISSKKYAWEDYYTQAHDVTLTADLVADNGSLQHTTCVITGVANLTAQVGKEQSLWGFHQPSVVVRVHQEPHPPREASVS